MIIYCWMLTIGGAFFLGGELTIMKHDMDRDNFNIKLQQCHAQLVGGMYGKD